MQDLRTTKRLLREEIWNKLESERVARFPLPSFGRIPNFVGSEKAADKAKSLSEWKKARVVFANPDYAQQTVRENTLLEGKMLVMASPKLKHGYVIVDPVKVKGIEGFASTIRGAFKYGRAVSSEEIPKPDLIVEGSVAVDSCGHRLGKGQGYGDIEIGILKRIFGAIPVVTTVHDLQVLEKVPFEEKDENVTIIVTPTRIVRISASHC
jgi:5-formyltetrahydrofolate cyclo-ligase